jgi:hypothetical protein
MFPMATWNIPQTKRLWSLRPRDWLATSVRQAMMMSNHDRDEESSTAPPVYLETDIDDWVDEDLLDLASAPPRAALARPVLMIAVIALGIYILSEWEEEFRYFLSPDSPIELGDATDFATLRDDQPNWKPPIAHNRYVSLSGIPSQRSQSSKHMFFRLVGSSVFVETTRTDYIEDPLEREFAKKKPGVADRTWFQGKGRALSFVAMPERYHGLRAYYERRYGIVFCDPANAASQEKLEEERRGAIARSWAERYDAASSEERERRGLHRVPTPEDLAHALATDPVCLDAYLLQDGTGPSDFIYYILAGAIFALFVVLNLVLLVRWGLQSLRT